MNRPCALPICQGGPATCAVLTGAGANDAGSLGARDTSQISSSAINPAAKNQGQRLRERRWRSAWTGIGMEGCFGFTAVSGGYCGRPKAGDSMPRAWSIFSATLKAASSSLMPCCCMSW